jgi:hypothetical protein
VSCMLGLDGWYSVSWPGSAGESGRTARVMHGTIDSPGLHTLEVEVLLSTFAIEMLWLEPEEDLPRVCPSCSAVVHGDDEPDWAASWRLYDCWHEGSSP